MRYLVLAKYDDAGGIIEVDGVQGNWERLTIVTSPEEDTPATEELAEALADSSLPDEFDGELAIVPLDRAQVVRLRSRASIDISSWGGNPF